MTLTHAGGIAAMVCAGTYLAGFAVLARVLMPLGYGTHGIDAAGVVTLIQEAPQVLMGFNLVIYVINAVALVVLVVALAQAYRAQRPDAAAVMQAFGLVWVTLVLGAGMIANVAAEHAARLALTDPEEASRVWLVLHQVELGLGGGNEVAGAVWIGLSSAMTRPLLSRFTAWLGIVVGAAGLLTVVPALGDPLGAVFGLGAILWFAQVGVHLLRQDRPSGHFRL